MWSLYRTKNMRIWKENSAGSSSKTYSLYIEFSHDEHWKCSHIERGWECIVWRECVVNNEWIAWKSFGYSPLSGHTAEEMTVHDFDGKGGGENREWKESQWKHWCWKRQRGWCALWNKWTAIRIRMAFPCRHRTSTELQQPPLETECLRAMSYTVKKPNDWFMRLWFNVQ